MNTEARFAVPGNVRDAVIARWPELGPQWCARVEAEFRELCAHYAATPIAVMRARYGFVVKVDAAGTPLVLRASPDPDGARQAQVADALGGLGIAPRVREMTVTNTGTWLVMDCVVPGTPWADLPTNAALIDALGATLSTLQGQPPPVEGMPLIGDWLRGRLEDDELTDLAPGRIVAPLSERRAAMTLLAQLSADGTDGLCHGDVSAPNVLTGEGGRLFLVDPRGCAGDIAYDVAVAAMKAMARGVPPSMASHLSASVGADLDHVRAWMVVAEVARV